MHLIVICAAQIMIIDSRDFWAIFEYLHDSFLYFKGSLLLDNLVELFCMCLDLDTSVFNRISALVLHIYFLDFVWA